MDFEARMIQFLGETTGTSKNGNPWKKKEWLLETFGQYPRRVKVQCFGDRSDSIIMEPGKDYRLSVDLESREFNGRWYTDVSVYRVAPTNGSQETNFTGNGDSHYNTNFSQNNNGVAEGAPYGGSQFGGIQPNFPSAEDNGEDLPF